MCCHGRSQNVAMVARVECCHLELWPWTIGDVDCHTKAELIYTSVFWFVFGEVAGKHLQTWKSLSDIRPVTQQKDLPLFPCTSCSSIHRVSFTQYNDTWVHKGIQECKWMHKGIQECPWVHKGIQECNECTRVYIQECPWVHKGIQECPWAHTEKQECLWVHKGYTRVCLLVALVSVEWQRRGWRWEPWTWTWYTWEDVTGHSTLVEMGTVPYTS